MEITQVEGYNYEQWTYLKNKLNSITFNRFGCFLDNHILKQKCLFEEFAPMLERNFKLLNANWDTINGLDFMSMSGGWKNGEISMNKGFAEMLNPEHYGKDPKTTVAVSDGIKSFLKVWGLFSRSINCGSDDCCNCGCSCEIKMIEKCCK